MERKKRNVMALVCCIFLASSLGAIITAPVEAAAASANSRQAYYKAFQSAIIGTSSMGPAHSPEGYAKQVVEHAHEIALYAAETYDARMLDLGR